MFTMSSTEPTTRRQRKRAREERVQAREAQVQASLVYGKDRDLLRAVTAKRNGDSAEGYWHKHLGKFWDAERPGRAQAREQFYQIVKALDRKASNLLVPELLGALWLVAEQKWVRDLDEWRPKNKSREGRFRSLVSHVLMKYPTPQFLFSAFLDSSPLWVPLAILVGQGGSLKQAQEHLPIPFTKRMWHMFLNSRAHCTVLEAIRTVQVDIAGGDRRVLQAVLGSPIGNRIGSLGRGAVPVSEAGPIEAFWHEFIVWVCRQGMLDPNQINPLYDYLSHCRQERAQENLQRPVAERRESWTLKGRTVASVMRGMEEWHTHLTKVKKIVGTLYDPSGFNPGIWDVKQPPNPNPVIWTMEEVLTAKRLALEGKTLRHCVYSYGGSIQSGAISIWSLSEGGDPKVTVEVQNKLRRIVQARGYLNRALKPQEANLLTRWARDNGLQIQI